jgi:hypothetical protein
MARTIHLLNSLGHVTVHWDEQNDATVVPAIQSMLDRGYKFFILDADSDHVPVISIADVTETRRIVISDDSLQQLHDAGLLQVGGVIVDDDIETTGELAKTVEAVTEHDTLVTQPASGG